MKNFYFFMTLTNQKTQTFLIGTMNEDECAANFRFKKNDIYDMKDLLQIPDDVHCYNGTKVDGIEALCIFMRRFAYPIRYGDMISAFGRPVPELCMIFTTY